MYKTGDLNKNIEKLKSDLRLIKFSEKFDLELLKDGNPVVYLPILHYIFLSYSKNIAQMLLENDYEMFSKSDKEFIEKIFKALINLFNYKPNITIKQFFSNGYAEAKVIFCSDVIRVIKQENQQMIKKQYNPQNIKNLKSSNSKNKNNESFRSAKSSHSNSNAKKNLNFNNFLSNNYNHNQEEEEDFINYQFKDESNLNSNNNNNIRGDRHIKNHKDYNTNDETNYLFDNNQINYRQNNMNRIKNNNLNDRRNDHSEIMPTSPKFNSENEESIKNYDDAYFNKKQAIISKGNKINNASHDHIQENFVVEEKANSIKNLRTDIITNNKNEFIPNSVQHKPKQINKENININKKETTENLIQNFKKEVIEYQDNCYQNPNFNTIKNKQNSKSNKNNIEDKEEPEAYNFTNTLITNNKNNYIATPKDQVPPNIYNNIINQEKNRINNNIKNQTTGRNDKESKNIDFTSLVGILNGLGETVKLMTNKIETFKSNIENRVGNLEAEMAIIKNKISIYENSKIKQQQQILINQSLNNNSIVATLPNNNSNNQSNSHHDDYIFSFAAHENINVSTSLNYNNNNNIQQSIFGNNNNKVNNNQNILNNNNIDAIQKNQDSNNLDEFKTDRPPSNMNNHVSNKNVFDASSEKNKAVNCGFNANNINMNNYNTITEGPVKIIKNAYEEKTDNLFNINTGRYNFQNLNNYDIQDKNKITHDSNLLEEGNSRRTNNYPTNNFSSNKNNQFNSANRRPINDTSDNSQSNFSLINNNVNKTISNMDDTDAMIKRVSERFKETQKLLKEFK